MLSEKLESPDFGEKISTKIDVKINKNRVREIISELKDKKSCKIV